MPATTASPIATLRRAFPRLRRTRSTAIIHSGGRQTIFGCLCGAEHTTSTEWHGRDAVHVAVWRQEHEDCAARLAAEYEAGRTLVLDGTTIKVEA